MIRNGMLVLAVAAGLAYGEPITYQGQLVVDGFAADGLFDLECRIFDAGVDGVQLGQTVVTDDHVVVGGLLNVALDFGDAFDSTSAYLEISLRLGESEDVYDILSPRQLMTPVPKAIHAIQADSLAGPGWSEGSSVIFGGDVLKFGLDADRVIINGESPLVPFEYFGVHVGGDEPVQTGGIIISNEDPLMSTIFAHVSGGTVGASQVFNGEFQTWTLSVDATDVLVADTSGVKSPSFGYTNSVTQAVTVAGDVFHSSLGTPFRASFFGGGAYLSTPGANDPLVAPISLPHGATITKLVARFEDNAASDIFITLNGAISAGSLIAIASVDTEDIAPFVGIQSLESTEIDPAGEAVNTFSTGYYIRVFSSSWPGDSSLRIWSVTVEYTVDAPD